MDKIGFVGLGIMGKPMCHNLLKAGFDVTFYARRDEIVAEMEGAGATLCTFVTGCGRGSGYYYYDCDG